MSFLPFASHRAEAQTPRAVNNNIALKMNAIVVLTAYLGKGNLLTHFKWFVYSKFRVVCLLGLLNYFPIEQFIISLSNLTLVR